MISLRKSSQRGHANHGWLDSYHTFSFADYYDPQFMGFESLRVINEDVVAPRRGFDMHPHRDMEIITYVLEGSLEHQDSLGHREVISPGEVQVITAGTGILHSEFNPSDKDPVHLLQIWIMPKTRGLQPRYAQKRFDIDQSRGKPLRIVSGREGEDTLRINQDVDLSVLQLEQDSTFDWQLPRSGNAWLQVTRGAGTANGVTFSAGDGVSVSTEQLVRIESSAPETELLLFEF